MAWVKLDDAMPTHPKLMAAGPQAFALDVAAICYSNKHATDGFIADYALPAVLPGLPSPKKYAAKLVHVGRWVEAENGWVIHDVGDYQPSAEQQKEISKKRAEAGRKGGSKSKRPSQASDKQSDKQVASVPDNPDPTRPDPTEERNPPSTDVDRDDRFEEFWDAYPARNGKKLNRPKAEDQWRTKVKPEERDAAIIGARHYAAAYEAGLPGVGAMDAFRWIRDRSWPDWQTPASGGNRDGPKQLHNVTSIDVGGRF